jgi:DNA polymerase-1
MAQLVGPNITLVNTMTGSVLDRAGVKNKFDVFPEQIVDYLALVGDASDNIPGVAKVGPKTAAKWLSDYGTLDQLVANAASITGKVGDSLRGSLKDLELSRRLATLDCAVALDLTPESLTPREPDRERLKEIYTRYELRALLRQLIEGASPEEAASSATAIADASPRAPRNYETILTIQALQALIDRMKAAEVVAFDTQTTSLDYMQAQIVGMSFSIEANSAAYVPVAHDYAGAPEQLSADLALKMLRPILEGLLPAKVGHHLKYDAHVLKRHGDHATRRCHRQGRKADQLQPGLAGRCHAVRGRNCRRHRSAAPNLVAEDCGSARTQIVVRADRTTAGAGVVSHGAVGRADRWRTAQTAKR